MPIPAMRRRYWVIAGIAGIFLAVVISVASIVPFSSEVARDKVVAVLATRFDADVELQTLRLRVLPTLHAEGDGLVIRHKGRRDVPPLITVQHFWADASVVSLYRRHLSTVK